ncbi:MAG: aminopeptidase P N-terminal domain-containing protein [Acidobacteriota bacterium]|nr:aminopeptidase P N-terminal domain-containing protein [Acidobacteriota bacterium]
MKLKTIQQQLVSTALFFSLAASLVPISARAESRPNEPTPAIRTAPPAPVFDDTERVAELAARRQRLAEQIGPKGVLVLFSAEPRVYTNDVDYEFRQENNFYYLTHLKQKGATLVIMPGHAQTREILFLPRRDPAAETWTGYMYGPEQARKLSGVAEIWEAKEFEPFMRALRTRRAYRPESKGVLLSDAQQTAANGTARPMTPPVPKSELSTAAAQAAIPARPVTGQSQPNLTTTNAAAGTNVAVTATTTQPTSPAMTTNAPAASNLTGFETLFAAMTQGDATLYLLIPGGEGESREYKQEQKYAAQWAQSATGLNVRNAFPMFTELRLRKSPMELKNLQHAIDVTVEALGRAMGSANRAQWEYEVEAEVEYTFKRRNADYWGYPSIVGCGPNATTLHYETSQGNIKSGDLLLMDVGAEYNHYTADVTRSFPVSGKFTPAQAEIYNVVLAAQEAGMKATRPGASIPEVHGAALEVIKDGLLRLGLITDKNSDQYRMWFMHGTSHWLGMNVHDVGGRATKFEPGMVFTNEPGIYIRLDALDYLPDTPESQKFKAAVMPAFEKYKGIGVRIEDDILVTADGYRNMSEALPRTIPDIENFIARAQKEMRANVELPSLLPKLAARHGFVSVATGRTLAMREVKHRH